MHFSGGTCDIAFRYGVYVVCGGRHCAEWGWVVLQTLACCYGLCCAVPCRAVLPNQAVQAVRESEGLGAMIQCGDIAAPSIISPGVDSFVVGGGDSGGDSVAIVYWYLPHLASRFSCHHSRLSS